MLPVRNRASQGSLSMITTSLPAQEHENPYGAHAISHTQPACTLQLCPHLPEDQVFSQLSPHVNVRLWGREWAVPAGARIRHKYGKKKEKGRQVGYTAAPTTIHRRTPQSGVQNRAGRRRGT